MPSFEPQISPEKIFVQLYFIIITHYKTFAIEAWTKDIQALIIALYCCLINVVNT